MFRRNDKDSGRNEDTLFSGPGGDTATVLAPTAPSMAAASNPTAPAAPAAASPAAPASRPMPETRTPSAPTATAFRANPSPLNTDIARNRMPEAKGMPTAGKDNKSGRRVLTVGNDILLKGEIATCDRLVIEGKVDATLNEVHTVEIAESGSFKGSAQIEDAEISGLFEGELIVRNRLIIYATGKVRGKISYGEIEIERGGELTGEIKTTSTQSQTNRRPGGKEDKFAA